MSGNSSTPTETTGHWRERFPNRNFSSAEIAHLNQRYGNARQLNWKVPAIIALAIGLPWLIWSATHHSLPEIRYTLISFKSDSTSTNTSIDITYEVERRNPMVPITCTLVARDIDKNIVGEFADQIPATTTSVITRKTRVLARSIPVNAAVIRCATT